MALETAHILVLSIVVLFILLLLTLFMLVSYSGLFHNVKIGAGPPPVTNMKVVYKFGKGSYKDASPVFSDVTSIAPRHKCFGVYYDDPTEVPADELQWAVGCILAEGEETPESALIQTFREKGYHTFHFPAVSYVVHANFPCRTQLSVLLGIYRVYPELSAYVKDNRLCAHPWLEIYDGSTIHYMAPLARQSDFYVPETDPDYQKQLQLQLEKERGQGDHIGISQVSTRRKPNNAGQGDVEEDGPSSAPSPSSVPIAVENKNPNGEITGDDTEGKNVIGADSKPQEAILMAKDSTAQPAAPVDVKQEENTATKVPKIDENVSTNLKKHSCTPVLRSNVVTDSQGHRASGSRSRGRSEGLLLKKEIKDDNIRGSKSASEPKNKKEIQVAGITSTTLETVFSDSDTLTDGDVSDVMTVSDTCSEGSYVRSCSEISGMSYASSQLSSCVESGDDFLPSVEHPSPLLELSSDSDGESPAKKCPSLSLSEVKA